jgi:ThiF family protein/E2/UBC family protein C
MHLAQLSQGRLEDTDELFAPGRVTAVLGRDAAPLSQAQACFSFAVNLLARLHPVIQDLEVVVPPHVPLAARIPRWQAVTLDAHLRLLIEALDPPLRWRVIDREFRPSEVSLVVGSPETERSQGATHVYFGSEGWCAEISPRGPVPVGVPINSIGAYAAACLGVAEVWKLLVYPHRALFPGIPIIPLDAPLRISAFTYRSGDGEPNPELARALALGKLTIIGLGAGGGATAFALASLPAVTGDVNLIDPDAVEESNLNRYVFADAHDAREKHPKTLVVGEFLRMLPVLRVREFRKPFRDVTSELTVGDYRYVAAAVHSREARREIQYETPMVLWDAGATGDGEFRIWRMALGLTECMFCKHPPGAEDPERQKAEQLARLLGLDGAAWLRKIGGNELFLPEEIAALRVPESSAVRLPFPGQRYGDWEAEECGRLLLPAADDEVPVPFAPVMAGVLLAGEIVKEHLFPEARLDSRYWNTLTGRFLRHGRPHRRTPAPSCVFCHDPAYVDQYRRRWGGGSGE